MSCEVPRLSPEDTKFFLGIAADIKARPSFYWEAGKWLDDHYDDAAFAKRARDERSKLLRESKAANLSGSDVLALRDSKGRRIRKWYMVLARYTEAVRHYTQRSSLILNLDDAKRVLLLAWLMSDPEAEKSCLGLTAFEKWPWDVGAADRAWIGMPRSSAAEWAWGLVSEPDKREGRLSLIRNAWLVISESLVPSQAALASGPAATLEPQSPALDAEDVMILKALADAGQVLKTLYDLEADTRMTRKTIGPRVNRFIELGLAVRAKGERAGVTLTDKGRECYPDSTP